MNKVRALSILVLIFLMAAGLGEEPVISSSSIPNAVTLSSVPSSLEFSALHSEVLHQYDAGNYSEAVRLLHQMKNQYGERYRMLPYELLYANCLKLAGESSASFEAYRNLANDETLSAYTLLPMARIATEQGKRDVAVSYYQQYLSNGRRPDYYPVALEALNYALTLKSPDSILTIAREVELNSSTRRTGKYYVAKAYLLRKDIEPARLLLRSLLERGIKDDITIHAMLDLDPIEGNHLTKEEQIYRGKLAGQFWNFGLVKEYLEIYAQQDIEYAYLYGRALFQSGDSSGAKAVFQRAIETWPQDAMVKMCLSQYAGICLRDGDFKKAELLYRDLMLRTTGKDRETATFKYIQCLRAQSRLQEALVTLQPLSYSKNASERVPALFLRGRIYFQAGRYLEASVDFDQLLKTGFNLKNRKEVLFWKGLTQEKLSQAAQSKQTFASLSAGEDFFAMLAREKLNSYQKAADKGPIVETPVFSQYQHLCGLPDFTKEGAIKERMAAGDILPALLYLHLFEDAAKKLESVSAETWNILGIDAKDNFRKYLEIAHIASLGKNYQLAVHYSEILQNSFLKNVPLSALPEDVLLILFPYPFRESVESFSRERGLDPYYVISIMRQESKFKRFAKSPAFARGLMQLIPTTALSMAESLGIVDFTQDQLYRPELNINLGTRYLQEMVKKFGTRPEIVAAGYNSGESNVNRWLACTSSNEVMEFFSNIDLAETKDYVIQVRTNYDWYRRIYGKNQDQHQQLSKTTQVFPQK
jgi:peptidoglycan lytic transglycosylase